MCTMLMVAVGAPTAEGHAEYRQSEYRHSEYLHAEYQV